MHTSRGQALSSCPQSALSIAQPTAQARRSGTQHEASSRSRNVLLTRRFQLRRPFAGSALRFSRSNGSTVFAAQWLENSAEMEVQVPLEKAWDLWRDRESIPKFMPWIRSVTVEPDDSTKSRWLLSTNQFGRDWEFSWLAQDLTPIKNQKIHWRSLPGSTAGSVGSAIDIANRGQIRFYRRSPDSCAVKLTISYELPDVLVPFGNGLSPLVSGILQKDMNRFAEYAVKQ